MIYILLAIILIAAFLTYSILKVRLAPTVSISGPVAKDLTE